MKPREMASDCSGNSWVSLWSKLWPGSVGSGVLDVVIIVFIASFFHIIALHEDAIGSMVITGNGINNRYKKMNNLDLRKNN